MARFKCLICGKECCTFSDIGDAPLVFPWEKRSLENMASRRGIKLGFKPWILYKIDENKYVVALYKWIIKDVCPFLTSGNKCGIHEEKPLICKMFPLLIGWDDNTLRVSTACSWIAKNIHVIRRGKPNRIFPKEFRVAVEVFTILKEIENIATSKRWKRIVNPVLCGNEDIMDIDVILK